MLLNGITVVLEGSEKKYSGMSISWATLVEKNYLVISAPTAATTTSTILKNKIFSVNVLSVGQEDIAKQFGGHASLQSDRIDKKLIKFNKNKPPVLESCCSIYICKLSEIKEINKQVVIIGKIIDYKQSGSEPLKYDKGAYFD